MGRATAIAQQLPAATLTQSDQGRKLEPAAQRFV